MLPYSDDFFLKNKLDIFEIRLKVLKSFMLKRHLSALGLFGCSNSDNLAMRDFFLKDDTNIFTVTSPVHDRTIHWVYPMTHQMAMFLDLDCSPVKDYLSKLSTVLPVFNGSYAWLAWSSRYKSTAWFDQISLFVNSDITFALKEDSGVKLYRIMKAHPESFLNVTEVGLWLPENSIQLEYNDPKLANFEGLRLRVSMVLTDLKVNMDDMEIMDQQLSDKSYHPELDTPNRYFYVINDVLRIMCNYTWDIVMTNTWGYYQPNGHFNGMIGTVENNTADYAMGPAEPRQDRMMVASFLIPLHGFRTCFVFRQPKTLGTYKALASPMDTQVWSYIFGITFLGAITYKVVYSFSRQPGDDNEPSLSGGFLLAVGVIAQQGLLFEQRQLSGKILCIFLLFLSLMSLAYYNAAIMNSLLSPSPVSIRTLDELIASRFHLGLLNLPYIFGRIYPGNPLTSGVMAKIAKGEGSVVQTLAEGVSKVKLGRYAFYAEDTILFLEIDQTYTDSEKCDLSEIEMLRPYPVSSSIQKGSPFIESFNRGIILLMERGILFRESK